MGESIQGSDRKASSDAHGVAMLSCELCTKRKIRCDKKQPCTACVKAGKECSPVVRARLPRGRRGGRKEANTELRNRVRRLEDLVLSLSGNPAGDPSPNSDFSSLAIDESKTDASLDRPLQDTPAFPPKNVPDGQYSPSNDRDISRLLGSSVWAQLSNELSGLRSILETRDEDDEGDQIFSGITSPRSEKADSTTDSPLGFDQQDDSLVETNVSFAHLQHFLDIYARSVDPVLRLLHMRTFRRALETGSSYMDFAAKSNPLQALRSAVFYVSVCTQDDTRCRACFGESKETLQERWRTWTEHYLRLTDPTNNHNIVILQALLLYTAAIRTHNNGPRAWTMIGLATRVAYSLQLHREEAYTSLSFYQGQIYRMCWAVLLGLDYQASFDRGSDPCNAVDSWNTKPPLNLNDDEWGVDTDKNTQWPERREPTDMIFMMIATTCARLVRELSFVPPGDIDRPPKPIQHSWDVRRDSIARLEKLLYDKYLQYCSPTDPLQFAALYLGKVILSNAQLSVFRPMQPHPSLTSPLAPGTFNLLLLATESLEQKEVFYHDTTIPWHWLFKSYVDWHPLAIILAELCSPACQHDPLLVERAWAAVDAAFRRLGTRVAEGTSGSLWQSLRKLFRMAQRRRAMDRSLSYATTATTTTAAPVAPSPTWPTWPVLEGQGVAMSTGAGGGGDQMGLLDMDLTTGGMSQAPGTGAEFDYGRMGLMDDSWMNWQGFVDDLAQNSYIGFTTDLGSWPQMQGMGL